MRTAVRLGAMCALVLLALSACVLLWPVHQPGLSGSAWAPHYSGDRFPVTVNIDSSNLPRMPANPVQDRRGIAIVLATAAAAVLLFVSAMRARGARRAVLGGAVVVAAVALAVLLWPLHARGLLGSALVPHYEPIFYWGGSRPSDAALALPRKIVDRQRHIAEIVAIAGLAAALGMLALQPRLRRDQPAADKYSP
jgi:hypothetical protein